MLSFYLRAIILRFMYITLHVGFDDLFYRDPRALAIKPSLVYK